MNNSYELDNPNFQNNLSLDKIKQKCNPNKISQQISDYQFLAVINALPLIDSDAVEKPCNDVLSNIHEACQKKYQSKTSIPDGYNINNCAGILCLAGCGCMVCGLPCLLLPPLCAANPMTTLPLISEGIGALCTIGGCCLDIAAYQLSAFISKLSSIQKIKSEIQLIQENNQSFSEQTIEEYRQELQNVLNIIDEIAQSVMITKKDVFELIYDVLEINECMQTLNELCKTQDKDATDNIDTNYNKNTHPISNNNNKNESLNNIDTNIKVKK